MQDYSEQTFVFTSAGGCRVEATFDEPAVTSDGGAVVLRELLERSELLRDIARALDDDRRTGSVQHPALKVIRQRVAQICCGYFKADDGDKLREDPAMVLAAGGVPGRDSLASQPTVSRFENRADRRALLRIGYAFVDDYMRSFNGHPPEAVLVDMDPTAITVYGQQQLALFNGFEDEYCLMPFHVYDGITGRLITTVIRPGKTPTDREILAIQKRIVRRLRAAWPQVKIIFRADSHHTKPAVMEWMERNDLFYVTGLGPNARLDRQFAPTIRRARTLRDETLRETRLYASGGYAADSWNGTHRRVICRVVAGPLGVDTRYIVTNFERPGAKYLYETVYCDRGKAELMIKDHKLDLGSGHASCHQATANQFRLFLHSAAYTIMHRLREALQGTELARARFSTLQTRLLKIGARVEIRRRTIRFHLPKAFPLKEIFAQLVGRLMPLRA
jgi:hypothetical protein